jgi:hypothetical protein
VHVACHKFFGRAKKASADQVIQRFNCWPSVAVKYKASLFERGEIQEPKMRSSNIGRVVDQAQGQGNSYFLNFPTFKSANELYSDGFSMIGRMLEML